MSREDPQFRIRLPVELKEKIEGSAKENSRSLNAEIVSRLSETFLNDAPTDEIISAKDVIEMAKAAKSKVAATIFKRTFAEINKKVRLGHTSFVVDLGDLELDILNEEEFDFVLEPTLKKLNELGYEVPENVLDVDGFLIKIP